MLAEQVPTLEPPAAFSVSLTGALAFTVSTSADRSRLVWMDRSGKELGVLGASSYGSNISISPDGRQIAFDSIESDQRTRRIWSADPVRGVVTLLTAPPRDWTPATSSEGDVAFSSAPNISVTRSSALGTPRSHSIDHRTPSCQTAGRLMGGSSSSMSSIRPDGQTSTRFGSRIASRSRSSRPTRTSGQPRFSPDGRWIAYSSDETGTREVYVRDFAPGRVPAVGVVKMRVSTNGGDKPRWRRDGTEL